MPKKLCLHVVPISFFFSLLLEFYGNRAKNTVKSVKENLAGNVWRFITKSVVEDINASTCTGGSHPKSDNPVVKATCALGL
ncbi:hypothetical protein OESDEN_21442 [Oesophagostomum dentatum]|uniref:Secreted protein n=1 Tax=Oesophagostomum dentatum TaxID=61180 RepID=A0A0B1S1W5_OESDE|nr:hypothetical protein OESDEN_21442 [Oesophagostomum dentatum]